MYVNLTLRLFVCCIFLFKMNVLKLHIGVQLASIVRIRHGLLNQCQHKCGELNANISTFEFLFRKMGWFMLRKRLFLFGIPIDFNFSYIWFECFKFVFDSKVVSNRVPNKKQFNNEKMPLVFFFLTFYIHYITAVRLYAVTTTNPNYEKLIVFNWTLIGTRLIYLFLFILFFSTKLISK